MKSYETIPLCPCYSALFLFLSLTDSVSSNRYIYIKWNEVNFSDWGCQTSEKFDILKINSRKTFPFINVLHLYLFIENYEILWFMGCLVKNLSIDKLKHLFLHFYVGTCFRVNICFEYKSERWNKRIYSTSNYRSRCCKLKYSCPQIFIVGMKTPVGKYNLFSQRHCTYIIEELVQKYLEYLSTHCCMVLR